MVPLKSDKTTKRADISLVHDISHVNHSMVSANSTVNTGTPNKQ